MTSRALIFDRDGVLTYFDLAAAATFFAPLLPISVWEMAAQWQEFGETHGFPSSVEAEHTFFAAFWAQMRLRHGLSPAQHDALLALDYTQFVRAFPDARPALHWAHQAGFRTGVLSNFTLASLDASLCAAGLAGEIDAACAATVIGAAKPYPAAYRAIAATLGVAPGECLFFDDELICVEGAAAAGMRGYLVDRRQGPAAGIIHSLDLLQALVEQAE